VRKRRVEGRELLYVPVTENDKQVRRDRRYRIGRAFDGRGRAGLTVALLGIVAVLAQAGGWISGEPDSLTVGGDVVILLFGIAGFLGVYCWWFFERQERSELRRAYRFRTGDPHDDQEIAAAKRSLLSRDSTIAERKQAVDFLLSRGACSLNRVSAARELLGYVVAFAVLALCFLVIARLT
jgi:hypothetical protein